MFFSLQTMIMNRFVTQAVRSVPNDSGQYNPLYFHRPKVGNRDWIVSPTKLTASSATKATVRAEHWDVPCVLGQPDLPLPACTGPLFESFTQFLFPISVYISSRGLGWLRFAEDELFDNGFLRKL
jgi:hypothetical protein